MKQVRSDRIRHDGDKAAKVRRTESAFQKERARIRAVNDEKTARLRGLRLAKEAREREVAEAAAALAAADQGPNNTKPKRKRAGPATGQ